MTIDNGICKQCIVDGLSPETLVRIVATGILHSNELSEPAQIVVAAAADKLGIQLGNVISS